MKHSSRRQVLAALSLGIAALGAQAVTPTVRMQAQDSLINDHQVIMVGGDNPRVSGDSVRTLLTKFYVDQFRNYQDPAAPYFMFLSRDANMAMGIGGVVRMRAYFDPGNSMPTPAFNPINIPVERTPLNRNHLGTTPSGTCLFWRLLGRHSRVGDYQLYIQAKFNGYNGRDFKLSKAYATVGDWTVGYATSTFSDGAALAPCVDANGGTLSMDFTSLLVRWMHSFKKSGFSVAASVETPEMSLQTSDDVQARATSMPNLAAMLQYEWAPDQHVRFGAITRFLPYRDMLTGSNHTPVGYGFELSSVFNITPALTVYAIGNMGRSYSNVGGDFLLGQYDLVGDPDSPGRLKTVPGWSYFLGLGYHFTTKAYSSVTFGQARNNTSMPRMDDGYKYGLYGAANFFYSFTPRISAGVECNFGKRQEVDGAHGWARRIGAMCQFSF